MSFTADEVVERLKGYRDIKTLRDGLGLIELPDGSICNEDKSSATSKLEKMLKEGKSIWEKLRPFVWSDIKEKADQALKDMKALVEKAQRYDDIIYMSKVLNKY